MGHHHKQEVAFANSTNLPNLLHLLPAKITAFTVTNIQNFWQVASHKVFYKAGVTERHTVHESPLCDLCLKSVYKISRKLNDIYSFKSSEK